MRVKTQPVIIQCTPALDVLHFLIILFTGGQEFETSSVKEL